MTITEPLYTPYTIMEWMKREGIEFTLHHHAAVFTVAEAEKVSHSIAGAHCRNLFLRDKKERMFLVTLRDQTKLDLKKLSDALGVGRFSFGSPERLWAYLGVKAGSVTPLAILNDAQKSVQLVLEQGMMREEILNFHPLDNTMTVGMSPASLLSILEKKDITPHILDMTSLQPDKET